MKKINTLLFVLSMNIATAGSYIDQIKVIDECTLLAEVITVKELKIKGTPYKDLHAKKAIRVCEKSLKQHPDDPHIKFLLARSYSKAEEHSHALRLMKASCEAGDIGGCTLLGGYYAHGITIPLDTKKANMLWFWGCAQGDGQACTNLAMQLENDQGYLPKDPGSSKKDLLLQACTSHHYPNACTVYANHMYFKTLPYNEDLFIYTNYRSCTAGDDNACDRLDSIASKIKKKASSEKKKISYYKESCNTGNAKACERLGILYAKKPRNRVNNLMAYTFLEEGCNQGAERFSCWYAGRYKLSGVVGVDYDIPLGFKYMEKACYIGMNSFACYDLAHFILRTTAKKYQDEQKARSLLKRACRIGNYKAQSLGCKNGVQLCCEEQEKDRRKK